MIAAKISRGYPLKILIITGLMIGALFNALLYILVLIKPNKMNQIANYFSEDLQRLKREVIYIGLIAIPIILILFSMVPAINYN